jgi:hypothetical protein
VVERHLLGWVAIGVAAAAAAVACFLPAFELAIEASIGAGEEQQSFRYADELTIATHLLPFGLLPLAAAVALLVAAAAAVVLGSRTWLVVAAFAVACGLGILVYDTDERLQWVSAGGVVGYEEPSGGPLLQPALDDLEARARSSPEAQEPGWELFSENGYASRGLRGWDVMKWSALALFWLTAYRLARLRLGVFTSVLAVAATSAALVVWVFWRWLNETE